MTAGWSKSTKVGPESKQEGKLGISADVTNKEGYNSPSENIEDSLALINRSSPEPRQRADDDSDASSSSYGEEQEIDQEKEDLPALLDQDDSEEVPKIPDTEEVNAFSFVRNRG